MGLFKGAAKAGIAAKAIQVFRREAAKPQNQAKARELFGRLQNRRSGGTTATTGRPSRPVRPARPARRPR